jgi:ribonuclease E
MEAADEIPRQLRLRDLGGVIICDFIDLRFERHRRDLERRLHDNLKNDRAKTKVLRMSQFGIIEMTRQRMRPSLKRSIYFDCPHCKGAGLVKTPESMSLDVMRRLAIAANDLKVARIELAICPDVAFYLLNKKRRQLAELEANAKKRIVIRQDPTLGLDEMKLELYDLRDGLVFLEELGMSPHETHPQPGHRTQMGRREDRHGRPGRHGQRGGGRHDHRRDERELDEERTELRGIEEADEVAPAHESPEEGASQPPSEPEPEREQPRSRGRQKSEEVEGEEESSVIDLDDAAEPMGDGPRAFDDNQGNGGRRGRRRRRGRRGRGGREQGGQGEENRQQRGHREESRDQRNRQAQRDENEPDEAPAVSSDASNDSSEEAPEPGNEKHPTENGNAEGDPQRKRRRRRGGRRHRRRRERAEAAARGETLPEDNGSHDASDESEEIVEPESSSDDESTDEESNDEPVEQETARRHTPVRIPPPPVVKTGSTDRHIVDDEPIDAPPPSRPRSFRDLDELPEDMD